MLRDDLAGAVLAARRREMDGVVCGHIHRSRVALIDGVLYCNDGDWVENCTTLVENMNGHLTLWHWPEQRERLLRVHATAHPEIEHAA